jgi:uncharacterized protein (UPF0210 family)
VKIRSVTIFNGRAEARTKAEIARAGKAAAAIRKRLIDAGFEVQTTRLALAPGYIWLKGLRVSELVDSAREVEILANDAGIDYVSLGPANELAYNGVSWVSLAEDVAKIESIPEVIAGTRAVFASAHIARGVVHDSVLRPVADAIKSVSVGIENGFGNLRFAALAECPPGIPFFPAAYASNGDYSFALALECADMALKVTNEFDTNFEAMCALTARIEENTKLFEDAFESLKKETDIVNNGCDWSLAPHPDESCSIGAAIEKLSGARFGEWGTLSAIDALTRAVNSAKVLPVGFSGVFLPLLEDAVLARRTKDITDLQRLLLYCSVCGSGLDTVPLAGDVSAEAIAALLGDVATLAVALEKPLTARLMPIPGLKAGEKTRFDFPYLVNGHALPL